MYRQSAQGIIVLNALLVALVVGPALPPGHGLVPPVSAARATAGNAPSTATAKKVTVAQQARQLATNLSGARSDATRYSAVLAVMKALHVRILEAKTGKRIVRPGKNSPRGFALYDFELRTMAGALGREELRDLPGVVQMLAAAGLTVESKPLDVAVLRTALLSGTRDAMAHPADRMSLMPLLARELGLRHQHPYDLAQNIPADALRFDSVQVFLILTDVLFSIYQQPRSSSFRSARRAADLCDNSLSDMVKEVMPFGKWGLALIRAASGPVKAAAVSLDAIHGPILAYSIKVYALSPELQSTHYGPVAHKAGAGKELRFHIVVEMLDQVRDVVIRCGPLLGVKFPKRGGVPGVKILWEQAVTSLEPHGTVSYDPADRKTGSNGVATLIFKPRDEQIVGFGLEKDARGVINGIALYQSAFGNIPGTLAQFLTPKWAGMAWLVTFHKARGFKFENLSYSWPGLDSEFRWSGHVCGDSPLGRPWTFDYFGRAEAQTNQGQVPLTFPAFGTSVMVGSDTIVQLLPPPQIQVKITFGPTGGSAPVVEDLSCPDNSQSP